MITITTKIWKYKIELKQKIQIFFHLEYFQCKNKVQSHSISSGKRCPVVKWCLTTQLFPILRQEFSFNLHLKAVTGFSLTHLSPLTLNVGVPMITVFKWILNLFFLPGWFSLCRCSNSRCSRCVEKSMASFSVTQCRQTCFKRNVLWGHCWSSSPCWFNTIHPMSAAKISVQIWCLILNT